MYNIYDKSNVFYLKDFEHNTVSLIGNENDLIKFLAKNIITYDYKDPSRWNNHIFENINMGNDFFINTKCYYLKDEFGKYLINEYGGYIYEKVCSIDNKKYLFLDGYNRIIDVRLWKDEVIKYYMSDDYKKEFRNKYSYKIYLKNRHISHSRTTYKNKYGNGKTQIRKLDSMFKKDSDFKEFKFKKLEDTNNPYPDWWDDTSRRVEGNWKSQYKVNKQWNIHKNRGDNKSIRKYILDEFSQEEIEDMLFEDHKF